jgi:hypothetical protein
MAHRARHSRIFVVRTWLEERGDGCAEVRGMMRAVASGETRYFHTWDEVVAFLDLHSDLQERRAIQKKGEG